jgi:glycosyltransferase involved in cell wall biosynthesis
MRGFDLFVRLAESVARRRPETLFVVVGAEQTYYGWDGHVALGSSFKEAALATVRADRSHFIFLGQIEPEELARVLAVSDLHVYLSVPFVTSWSLLNALSAGCVVLGPDDTATREFIYPDRNGLLMPLFDGDRWVEAALRVLAAPEEYRHLGTGARERVEGQHSADAVVPEAQRRLTTWAGG